LLNRRLEIFTARCYLVDQHHARPSLTLAEVAQAIGKFPRAVSQERPLHTWEGTKTHGKSARGEISADSIWCCMCFQLKLKVSQPRYLCWGFGMSKIDPEWSSIIFWGWRRKLNAEVRG